MQNGRDESDKERLDRNLNEMLGELRVALPGVQVLFAFLLAVPFQTGFDKVTEFEKSLYFATLLTTAVAAALLIAPSALHRIEFRKDDKHFIVFTANRLAVTGFAVLGVAMTLATVLIAHYLYHGTAAIVVAIVVGGLIFGLWYGLPLVRLRQLK
jgi:Family of unknown function (DUF6328)